MWGGSRYRAILRYANPFIKIRKDWFMSDSFRCETSWDNRFKSALLQKVNVNDMFFEMDNKFNQTKSISAVDVDIIVNAVNSESHLDEMEEVVLRLRTTPEATRIFPSTHHAFIRSYLAHGCPNELMRVLNDRLNYGIFPDNFCYILLLDQFVKKVDYRNAAKVAVLQMLQEDFSNDLIKYLSLYSCYKYLLNPTEWETPNNESEEKGNGEEIKVRVKYLRNPFFDNHFDLRERDSLIGKTLVMIGENIDHIIVKDVTVLGYILLKKWDVAKSLINDIIKNKQSVTNYTLDIIEKHLANETKEENENDEVFQDVKKSFIILKNENLLASVNLLEFLETKIKEEAASGETSIGHEQIKIYEEWENARDKALREEIEELNKAEKLATIKQKKQELIEREQELFFFERENEIDLTIENKRVRYPPKWHGKKKKKRSDDVEYIPPEITKKRS